MKILLKGYYGFGNLGDDILMKVSHGILRDLYPKADIYVYSENSVNNRNFNLVKEYNQYVSNILQEDVQVIDWTYRGFFDLVFNGGGGLYNDKRKGNIKHTIVNKLSRAFSPRQIANTESIVRKTINKPQNLRYNIRIGYGLGVGPYAQSAPTYLNFLAEVGTYDALFVRDTNSADFLKSISYYSPVHLISDIAFATSYWLPSFPESVGGKQNQIGFILRKNGNEASYQNLAEAKRILTAEGFNVSFFSFHQLEDQDFNSFFDQPVHTWQPSEMSLVEFLSKIKGQSAVVTARAHGAILAACLGVPSVCLGISRKMSDIASMLQESSIVLSPPFSPTKLVTAIKEVCASREYIIERLKHDVARNSQIVLDSISLLK